MEIPFQGQLNESMLRRTTLAALRPTRGRLVWILVFAAFFAWGVIIFPLMHGESQDLLGDILTYLPVLVIACAFVYMLLVWSPKKQLSGSKLVQGQRTGTVSEERIHLETPYGRSDLPWDVFTRAKIAKDMVLLYCSTVGSSVYSFPREFFASEADWEAFVDLVRQRAPLSAAKGSGKRLLITFLFWLLIFAVVVIYNAFKTGR